MLSSSSSTMSASTATTSFGGTSFSRSSSSGHYDPMGLRQAPPTKVKEKDALCRTMGTLFLQHRVDKLQCDVDQLERRETASAKPSGSCSWKSWKSGCPRRKLAKVENSFADRAAAEQSSKGAGSMTETIKQSNAKPDGRAKRIIIVDVSLLIYSLRTIHNWLKEGDCKVIVPTESLRTLDLLKKGDHYLNLAARKATRFLDERFASAALSDNGEEAITPGLFPQRDVERINCSDWRTINQLMPQVSLRSADLDLRQQPHTIRETMSCTMYFVRRYTLAASSTGEASSPSISLGLALPPPHFDCSENHNGVNGQCLKNAQRADGSALLRLARQLGLGDASSAIGDRLIVAPTASSWLMADASGKVKDAPSSDTNG